MEVRRSVGGEAARTISTAKVCVYKVDFTLNVAAVGCWRKCAYLKKRFNFTYVSAKLRNLKYHLALIDVSTWGHLTAISGSWWRL